MDNDSLKKMLKNSDPASLKARLNPEQQALLNSLLNDKAARDRFLSSPEAQNLLKMLGKK